MKVKPKAIFFDLDETLVNASQCHEDSLERMFGARGLNYAEILKRTEHIDFIGTRLIDVIKTMRDAVGVSEQELPASILNEERQQIFLDLVARQAGVLPGATEALEYAKTTVGQVAIASSGTRKYIQQCINQFGWEGVVDYFVGEEDTQRGKPYPDCFLEARKRLPQPLRATVQECVVVEDSINGVKAGQAAGMPIVWVPMYEHMQRVDLPGTHKLSSLLEFPATLDELGK